MFLKATPLLLLLTLACSSQPARVPVIGAPEDLVPLRGEWTGTYQSRSTGSSGSITFHLTDDPKGAHGDVVFVAPRAVVREAGQRQADSYGGAAVLAIEFVRIDNREISGKIAPYADPAIPNGTLETHFSGRMNGERIEGTFVTYSDRGATPHRGTWRVQRKR